MPRGLHTLVPDLRFIPCSLTNCSQRLLLYLNLGFCLPEEASSEIDFFVMCDMKPTMEKITNPANTLVVEFIQQTMMESLEDRKNGNKPPADPYQEARKEGWAKQKTKPSQEQFLCLGEVAWVTRYMSCRQGSPTAVITVCHHKLHVANKGMLEIRHPKITMPPCLTHEPCRRLVRNNRPVDIVVESVVAPQSDQRPQPQAIREEDLCGCIHPDLWRMSRERSAAGVTPCCRHMSCSTLAQG